MNTLQQGVHVCWRVKLGSTTEKWKRTIYFGKLVVCALNLLVNSVKLTLNGGESAKMFWVR